MRTNQKTVSFLIGSGFSVPAKLPSVECINNRVSNLTADDLSIHTSQIVRIIERGSDPNPSMENGGENFFEKFIRFYKEEILGPEKSFHYEEFYDYYTHQQLRLENHSYIDSRLIDFYMSFANSTFTKTEFELELLNKIDDFNHYFHQVIAILLKLESNESKKNCYLKRYDEFIRFLSYLKENHEIKIHTLNHDLLMEELVSKNKEQVLYFSDGFDNQNSPFFALISDANFLQYQHKDFPEFYNLPIFTKKFNRKINLYKLHGSIDFFQVGLNGPDGKMYYFKETIPTDSPIQVIDPKNKNKLKSAINTRRLSQFLSGYTYKIRQYQNEVYYSHVFDQFKENLKNSDILIVIGYGFKDAGINEYLEKYFTGSRKKLIVIDPYQPNYDFSQYNLHPIPKSICKIECQELIDILENPAPLT